MSKKVLSAADIFSAEDLRPTEVEVPEWGGTILCRPLTAAEALEFTEKFGGKMGGNNKDGLIWAVVTSAVDEDGHSLFGDANKQAAAMELLKQKSLKALNRIQDQIFIINGWAKDAREKAKND